MANTSIEWTQNPDGTPGKSWNPTRGCDEISPGCARCYAKTFAERWRGVKGHPYEQGFDLRLVPEKLAEPLTWKKPTRVFANSMSDLWHKDVPNEYIAACFGVMAAAHRNTFMTLTKRAERLPEWYGWMDSFERDPDEPPATVVCEVQAANYGVDVCIEPTTAWPLPNVWIGVSVENRKHGLPRIDHLRQVPAAVRFLSIEPLLEDLGELDLRGISWCLIGGESGPGARPFDLAWARRIIAQCREQGVACFFKQAGARPYDSDMRVGVYAPHDKRTPIKPDGAGGRMPAGNLVVLRNRKGADLAELPEDLRVREWPEVCSA